MSQLTRIVYGLKGTLNSLPIHTWAPLIHVLLSRDLPESILIPPPRSLPWLYLPSHAPAPPPAAHLSEGQKREQKVLC